VGKQVLVPGREDETSPELERIFAQLVLAMSAGLGALSRCSVVFAENVKHACGAQAQGLVGFPFFVNEQGKLDLGVFAKMAGVGGVAQADRDKLRASLFEIALSLAQLRDMLTAEDSAVVAQKNDHCRTAGPQAAQTHGIPIQIG